MQSDPYNLSRFVEAQDPVYRRVLTELGLGCKTSHWMWYVFPQIEGLGRTAMSRRFAISSLEEARAYLQHQVLGPRLEESTRLVCEVSGKTIHEIFGSPDDVKFRSSMTLFAIAAANHGIFDDALQKYFAGQKDPLTLERIGSR